MWCGMGRWLGKWVPRGYPISRLDLKRCWLSKKRESSCIKIILDSVGIDKCKRVCESVSVRERKNFPLNKITIRKQSKNKQTMK